MEPCHSGAHLLPLFSFPLCTPAATPGLRGGGGGGCTVALLVLPGWGAFRYSQKPQGLNLATEEESLCPNRKTTRHVVGGKPHASPAGPRQETPYPPSDTRHRRHTGVSAHGPRQHQRGAARNLHVAPLGTTSQPSGPLDLQNPNKRMLHKCTCPRAAPPPPPCPCEDNALVRATAGVVSTTFGTTCALPPPPPPLCQNNSVLVSPVLGVLVLSPQQGGGGGGHAMNMPMGYINTQRIRPQVTSPDGWTGPFSSTLTVHPQGPMNHSAPAGSCGAGEREGEGLSDPHSIDSLWSRNIVFSALRTGGTLLGRRCATPSQAPPPPLGAQAPSEHSVQPSLHAPFLPQPRGRDCVQCCTAHHLPTGDHHPLHTVPAAPGPHPGPHAGRLPSAVGGPRSTRFSAVSVRGAVRAAGLSPAEPLPIRASGTPSAGCGPAPGATGAPRFCTRGRGQGRASQGPCSVHAGSGGPCCNE